jgi:hypothetical protein
VTRISKEPDAAPFREPRLSRWALRFLSMAAIGFAFVNCQDNVDLGDLRGSTEAGTQSLSDATGVTDVTDATVNAGSGTCMPLGATCSSDGDCCWSFCSANLCASNTAISCTNYNVHPGDDLNNLGNVAPAGGTLCFAPGTYTLSTPPTFPTGRTYIGNGATLAPSVVDSGNPRLLQLGGSTSTLEFTGFVCTGNAVLLQSVSSGPGTYYLHDNTFTDGSESEAILILNDASSTYEHNTFTNLTGQGIFGDPGDSNRYIANTFDNVFWPIHLTSAADDLTVSNNIITRAQYFGFQLQGAMTNVTIADNVFSLWVGDGADRVGINAGGAGTTSITGNKIVDTSAPGAPCGTNLGTALVLQQVSGGNLIVTGNTLYGWGAPYFNGVCSGDGFTIANNTIYGNPGNANAVDTQDGGCMIESPYVDPTDTFLPLSAFATAPCMP